MNRFRWLSPLLDAEGDIGAASGAPDVETPSVEAGTDPAPGIAPEASPTPDEGAPTPDITKQKSFAERLKEERLKIEDEYKPHKQHSEQLQNIASSLGFKSVDDYLAAVNVQLKERLAAEEAQRLGVSPETYNQFFAPVKDDLTATKQELQQLRQAEFQRQVQAERDGLAAQHPDFAQVEEQVWQVATDRRLSLTDAYKLVTYDTRIAAVRQETEQQVLANVTGRDQKQVLSGKDKGGATPMDPASMSLADIAAISERVQRGERITF